MKRILITGANGFVAKYLKDLFKEDEVFLTDISGDDVIKCDITDKNDVYALINKTNPDEIYHLAAIASPRNEDRELVMKVNVTGTLNLLEAVREFCPKSKILLVSSGYVYGDCNKPADENAPTKPKGIYAESKLEMEKQTLEKFPNLNFVIARSFTHSGKNQQKGFFFPDIAAKIKLAKESGSNEIEVLNPDNKRDFTHVKDVVRAYKLIVEKGKRGEIYNICSGEANEVVAIFEKMAKASGMENYKIKGVQHGIVLDLVGNCDKLKKLGFKHKYSIDDIIKDFS